MSTVAVTTAAASSLIPAYRKIPGIPPTFTSPAEWDPNYKPEDIRKELLILGIVTLCCAVITAFLRVFAKYYFRQTIEWADWLMVPAVIFGLLYNTMNFIAITKGGAGRHLWDNTLEMFKIYVMSSFLNQIFYFLSIYSTKISIILFVRQLIGRTVMRPLKLSVEILLYASLIYCPLAIVILTTRCSPHPRALFDLEARRKYGCTSPLGDQKKLFYSIASVHSVLDVGTLVLPYFVIGMVRIRKKEKAVLCILFGLGIIACLCAILRLYYYPKSWDSTWEVWRAYTFGTLETNLSIICVCVPQLKKLAGHVGVSIASKVSRSTGSGSGNTCELKRRSGKGVLAEDEMPFGRVGQSVAKGSATSVV
ncbi:hypothetical protein BDD12DRAFT_852274 [Trichophaea hybrida]|nr:hypothetical protein BDD12DRAFT_852274 [Trichophaea hybrida]